jgi:type IV pilus assembly protein PilY1
MKFAAIHFLPRLRRAGLAAAWLMAVACGTALAASTDISNAPLFTSSATAVKPNIMFILDDSGSMASDTSPTRRASSR